MIFIYDEDRDEEMRETVKIMREIRNDENKRRKVLKTKYSDLEKKYASLLGVAENLYKECDFFRDTIFSMNSDITKAFLDYELWRKENIR